MPLDLIIDHPCRPKRELGGGDLRAGTGRLVGLLRVAARADAVRALSDGPPADDLQVKLTVPTPDGPAERTFAFGELERQAAELDPHVPDCTNCPVNALRKPFGCVGGLSYPVRKSTERFLLDRVPPPAQIGGALLLQHLEEGQHDGERTRGYRARGLFQAFPGPEKELPRNPFDKAELSADELFSPLLLTDARLAPWQSLLVLLWFDAVTLDGAVPKTADDALKLTRLEPAERAKRAKLNHGQSAADVGVDEARNLFKTLFVAWVRNADVRVDS